jgi:aminoglycoside phosphotransferase (APT) family kinase protein
MLSQADAVSYLLDRGLLTPNALLDDGLVVRDASSRNRNYRVETQTGPSYLLKQAVGRESLMTIANEAAAYERLGSAQAEGIADFLPGYFGYDAERGLLVLELVTDAADLRTYHASSGQFSAGPAAAVGRALGLLHRVTRIESQPAPNEAASVLWLHRPDSSIFRDISAASLALIRIVQQAPEFPEALDRVRSGWRRASLVHGDVKWDNFLVAPDESVRLIDWEGAMPGDPGWDIGSALSHYLSFWIFSIPVTGELPPERFPELAAYPLDAMKPALRACWIAYAHAFGIDPSDEQASLLRAIEYAGARLVQTAFEASQMQQQLTSPVVLHLQVAHNILLRPLEAADRLLGLRVGVR